MLSPIAPGPENVGQLEPHPSNDRKSGSPAPRARPTTHRAATAYPDPSYVASLTAPTGDPNDLVRVQERLVGGSGLVTIRCSRDALPADGLRLPEANNAGVYLLFGGVTPEGRRCAYIGQGDPLAPRLESHLRCKNFWTTCAFITSTGNDIHSGHIRRVEALLIAEARTSPCIDISENKATPADRPGTEEIERAAGIIIGQLKTHLALLGLSLTETPGAFAVCVEPDATSKAEPAGAPSGSPDGTYLVLRGKGITASARLEQDTLVVEAGSEMHRHEVPSQAAGRRRLRRDLLAAGSVAEVDGRLIFMRDVPFESPSAASTVLFGRPSSGNKDWKTPDGTPLGAIRVSN